MESNEKFYQDCQSKPFVRNKDKCLDCQMCNYDQYEWCLRHSKKIAKPEEIFHDY